MKFYAAVALLLLPAAFASALKPVELSSPLLLWSNRDLFGEGKRVSYQVLAGVEEVATDLVLTALGKASEGSEARVESIVGRSLGSEEGHAVVLFVGNQMDAADMRSRLEAVQSVDSVLSGATSSFVMPYTTTQGASIRDAVCGKLDQAGIEHRTVGCKAPSDDLKRDVAAALAKGGSQALVVCSNVPPALENTNAGLAAEVEQVLAVQSALEAAGGSHVFVYTSQATESAPAAAAGGKRRSLLAVGQFSGFGDYTTCGLLCQTQVRWLEGMLAVLFLALASCAGLVCLYVLDTPTRFESPKEAPPTQS